MKKSIRWFAGLSVIVSFAAGCATEERVGESQSSVEVGRSGGVPGTLVFDVPRNTTDHWAHVATRVEGADWTGMLCPNFVAFGLDVWFHIAESNDDGMTISEVMLGFHPDAGGRAAATPYFNLFDTRGKAIELFNDKVGEDLVEGSWIVFRVHERFEGPSVAAEGFKVLGAPTLQNGHCGFHLPMMARLV